MVEIKFKYRIDELLNQLTVPQYRLAMRIIPQQLNISPKTFANYRRIKLTDNQDIPHEKVVWLESIFEIKPGELQNFVITATPLSKLTNNITIEI
jgi:hypothetical protein